MHAKIKVINDTEAAIGIIFIETCNIRKLVSTSNQYWYYGVM